MPRRIVRACALAALALAAGCGGDSTVRPPVPASVRFAEAEPVVEVGARKRLEVTVLDDQGNPLAGAAVRFTSSRPDLVEVDSLTGMMTGKGLGRADVTAAAAPAQATVAVSVQPRGGLGVASVELASPSYPLLKIRTPPGTGTVPFTVRNAAGVSLCGLVPVQVEVADTSIGRAVPGVSASDGCALAIQGLAPGFTTLWVRAGARADSLTLHVSPLRYQWSFTPPERKVAGTGVRWHGTVVTDEGVPVSGVRVEFHYVPAVRTSWNGQPIDAGAGTVTVLTGADGGASLERILPASMLNSFGPLNESYTVRGWVTASGTFPDGIPFEARDTAQTVPGPAVVMGPRIWDCNFSSLQHCWSAPAGDRVVLRTTCFTNRIAQELMAVAYDELGNPTTPAPALVAEPGALENVRPNGGVGEYFHTTPFRYNWSKSYAGGGASYARLTLGRDSALVTLTHPSLPSRTVKVVEERNCA